MTNEQINRHNAIKQIIEFMNDYHLTHYLTSSILLKNNEISYDNTGLLIIESMSIDLLNRFNAITDADTKANQLIFYILDTKNLLNDKTIRQLLIDSIMIDHVEFDNIVKTEVIDYLGYKKDFMLIK